MTTLAQFTILTSQHDNALFDVFKKQDCEICGKFCASCGSPKPQTPAVCPGCGAPVSGGKFCPSCGTPL